MRPRSRLFVALLGLDLLFNPLIAACYVGVMGIASGGGLAITLQVITGVVVTRWIVMYALLAPGLRPLDEDADETDRVLVRGSRVAYRAPFVVAPVWALMNASAWPIITAVLLGAFPTVVPLPPGAVIGTGLIALAIAFGALVVSFPLIEWLLAPTVRRLSLAAQTKDVVIPGRGLGFRERLIAMALLLGTAPTLFLSAITYMADADHARRSLTASAEAAVTTAALARVEGAVPEAPTIAGAISFTQRADGSFDPPEIATLLAARPTLDDAVRDATARGLGATTASDPRTGATVVLRRLGDGAALGILVPDGAGASTATILTLIFFLTIIVLWAPLSAYFIARSTAEPVAQIAAALQRVRAGEVSQAELVPILHKDEVGALAESFNAMRAQLLALIAQANRVTDGDLTVMVDMPGELGDAFRNQVTSLRQMVGHTTESAAQLAVAAAEMYAAAQEQETAAQQQSSGVEEVTRTMESLLEAATHISASTTGVLAKAERTRATTGATAERIAELSVHAGRIAEILDVIREIADRSDILALNASLEGTRAGEAGRGFSLVASEMRKLAERVTASVHDIKALVADVRASVSATVMATEESTKLADGTTESARQISLVTQQQRSGTEQAGVSMRDVASMIAQSLSATQEIRALAGTLKQQADGLTDLVSRYRAGDVPRTAS